MQRAWWEQDILRKTAKESTSIIAFRASFGLDSLKVAARSFLRGVERVRYNSQRMGRLKDRVWRLSNNSHNRVVLEEIKKTFDLAIYTFINSEIGLTYVSESGQLLLNEKDKMFNIYKSLRKLTDVDGFFEGGDDTDAQLLADLNRASAQRVAIYQLAMMRFDKVSAGLMKFDPEQFYTRLPKNWRPDKTNLKWFPEWTYNKGITRGEFAEAYLDAVIAEDERFANTAPGQQSEEALWLLYRDYALNKHDNVDMVSLNADGSVRIEDYQVFQPSGTSLGKYIVAAMEILNTEALSVSDIDEWFHNLPRVDVYARRVYDESKRTLEQRIKDEIKGIR